MNRADIHYWVNIGLAISFFICFITGMIKWPGLIKIIGTSAYKILHVKNISLLHDWSGLIMGLLVLIHLALFWKCLVYATKKRFGKR
ncbi:MAG: DUF4405 domain-containing protein [Candidatus Aenigmarchaeota archaeon]|nr:DUF4405 domain-containing protein [Candidatus Aenigmarchaeota archaeon]